MGLLLFNVSSLFSSSVSSLSNIKKWFILLDYSADRVSLDAVKVQPYDLAILDADAHPDLALFKTGTVLLAYVSLGEAENYRFYWEDIKAEKFILEKNPDWGGNFYVDVRDQQWQTLILDQVIPRVVQAGFQGLFLDTLDIANFLEEKDPVKYKGSQSAMVSLVKSIHARYPDLLLVSNNGFAILDELAPNLSAVLVEDIFMMPDFQKGGYKKVTQADREYKVNVLNKVSSAYGLPVLVIDYVSQKDKKLIRSCLREIRRLGFKPYIAEKGLSEIYRNDE